MGPVDQNFVREYLRRAQLSAVAGLGDYGYTDTDTNPFNHAGDGEYDESAIFNGLGTRSDNSQGFVANAAGPALTGWVNDVKATLTPFTVGQSSLQVLNQNAKRCSLIIQNLSTAANLYVNFGYNASPLTGLLLSAGTGFYWDELTPSDSLYVYFDNAAAQNGILIEGIKP